MQLTAAEALASIAVMSAVTFLTRALPFLLFDRGEHPPKIVLYLGKVLPPAIIAMLIVYCMKGVTFSTPAGWVPTLLAGAAGGAPPPLEGQRPDLHFWGYRALHDPCTRRIRIKERRKRGGKHTSAHPFEPIFSL